jgi:hypothetical protein
MVRILSDLAENGPDAVQRIQQELRALNGNKVSISGTIHLVCVCDKLTIILLHLA